MRGRRLHEVYENPEQICDVPWTKKATGSKRSINKIDKGLDMTHLTKHFFRPFLILATLSTSPLLAFERDLERGAPPQHQPYLGRNEMTQRLYDELVEETLSPPLVTNAPPTLLQSLHEYVAWVLRSEAISEYGIAGSILFLMYIDSIFPLFPTSSTNYFFGSYICLKAAQKGFLNFYLANVYEKAARD